jgi:hypothetical protein
MPSQRKVHASERAAMRSRRARILHGLSPEQRFQVVGHLDRIAQADTSKQRGGGVPPGWSLYREPTTIHPPTVLRLLHRDERGRITQVISITERSNPNKRP